MRFRVVRTPTASRQIREAARWWRRNRTKAPALFRDELRQGIELIAKHPEAGAVAKDVALREVRRVLMLTTQYYIYYRVNVPAKRIDVLSVWSTHRGEPPPID
jgi:plasmid stabilization system protein ParE